jgi:hypothetical protein
MGAGVRPASSEEELSPGQGQVPWVKRSENVSLMSAWWFQGSPTLGVTVPQSVYQ